MYNQFTTVIDELLQAQDGLLVTHADIIHAVHNGGFILESTGQHDVCKRFQIASLSSQDDVTLRAVLSAANSEPALVGLTYNALLSLAQKGLALAAFEILPDGSKTFAAYLGAEDLDETEIGLRKSQGSPSCEIRSSVTVSAHRGYGLNTFMKMVQTINIMYSYGLAPIAFTDDIPSYGDHAAIKSASMGINTKLGFQQVLVANLPPAIKQMMVEPCPEGRCANRGDDHPACGCSIWVASPAAISQWHIEH